MSRFQSGFRTPHLAAMWRRRRASRCVECSRVVPTGPTPGEPRWGERVRLSRSRDRMVRDARRPAIAPTPGTHRCGVNTSSALRRRSIRHSYHESPSFIHVPNHRRIRNSDRTPSPISTSSAGRPDDDCTRRRIEAKVVVGTIFSSGASDVRHSALYRFYLPNSPYFSR